MSTVEDPMAWMRTCLYCGAESTDYSTNLWYEGKAYAGGICENHGGPRRAVDVPPNADEIEAQIKRDTLPYLHDLVSVYRDKGLNYGHTAQGFLEWGHASRYLTNIPPSGKPASVDEPRRHWWHRLKAGS